MEAVSFGLVGVGFASICVGLIYIRNTAVRWGSLALAIFSFCTFFEIRSTPEPEQIAPEPDRIAALEAVIAHEEPLKDGVSSFYANPSDGFVSIADTRLSGIYGKRLVGCYSPVEADINAWMPASFTVSRHGVLELADNLFDSPDEDIRAKAHILQKICKEMDKH